MATYFQGGPEMSSDSLQTLYLMNPGYVGYSGDATAPANMVLLNSTMNSLNPMTLAQAAATAQPSQQSQHFVGIPLQAAAIPSQDSGRPPSMPNPHDISALQGLMPRLHYNLWTNTASNNSIHMSSQLVGPRRSPAVPSPHQQGLSLSLSPQQTPYQYRPEPTVSAPVVADIPPATAEELRFSGGSSSASAVSNGVSGLQSVLLGSKYLKVAQQLLDEVVSVSKEIKGESMKGANSKVSEKAKKDSDDAGDVGGSSKRAADLTTAERQELHMKKAKLVNMLDEVEHRYRQYHHQMQIVVSSFETVAGAGSAKTYTALALQTISKQFRCLRDAISGQIRAAGKSLGEEDCLGGGSKSEGGSRLRFVDHHLRQQRALQQLGMIQHNAWRPQRGLPERSVSVLRAWLFEHFLHPYPKDSDKLMLAKQTGLTRSQVSNWFINARVRLWKPMVEEMYMEETKEQEQSNGEEKSSRSDGGGNQELPSKSILQKESSPSITEHTVSLKSMQDDPKPPPPIKYHHHHHHHHHQSSTLGSVQNHGGYHDNEQYLQPKLKKARSDELLIMEMKPEEASNREFLMKFGEGRGSDGDHGYPLITGATSHGGGFGGYTIGDIGRFDPEQFTPRFASGNGVSLTLGLPHCDNLSLPATAQASYLPSDSIPLGRRIELSNEANDQYCSLNNNNATVAHPSNAYESISIQRRKRFAAQLLPDFVA